MLVVRTLEAQMSSFVVVLAGFAVGCSFLPFFFRERSARLKTGPASVYMVKQALIKKRKRSSKGY
jgi:hypothetical protein